MTTLSITTDDTIIARSGPDITSDKVDGAKRTSRLSRNVVFTSPSRTFRANWNERSRRDVILPGTSFSSSSARSHDISA